MKNARLFLVVCLLVGLAAVWSAAHGHLREVRTSIEQSHERALESELRDRARDLAAALDRRLAGALPAATFRPDGTLVRPAPPAEARLFLPPVDSPAAVFLRRDDLDRAAKAAATPEERAAVLLARAGRGDVDALHEALAMEILRGTDLEYRLRLEIARAEGRAPDAGWIDDVSALLGGPSHRFAHALLREAGVAAVGSMEERRYFEDLRPHEGVIVDGAFIHRVREERGYLVLRRVRSAQFEFGAGTHEAPLPAPFGELRLRGDVDATALRAEVRAQTARLLPFYGLGALILAVGTVYAYIAIGRAFRLASDKNAFVANVTHELKTPLANIRLYGESLREGRVRASDREEFLDTILEETGRLDSLVEGLLHAARGPRLAMGQVDPGALVAETAARWRPRLEREGFELEVETPDELPAVRGDREALLRALSNLVDNARKYAGERRRIEIGGSARNGSVRVSVRDHGPGIPVAFRRRVLRPFARLEDADHKETEGTGLGLSLVHSCMEAHGGAVEIEDAPGAGARVSLILPVESR